MRYFYKVISSLYFIIFFAVTVLTIGFYTGKTVMFDAISRTRKITNTINLLDYLSLNISNIRMLSGDYVITGDTAYLALYEDSRRDVINKTAILSSEQRTIPEQNIYIDSLASDIEALIKTSDYYVSLKKKNSFSQTDITNKVNEEQKRRVKTKTIITRLTELKHMELAMEQDATKKILNNFQLGFHALVLSIAILLLSTLIFIRYNFRKSRTAQAIIKESEGRFAKFFNLSPVATSIADISTGKLLYINKAFEQLFAVKRIDAIGKTADELGISTKEEKESLMKEITIAKGRNNVELTRRALTGEQKIIYGSADIIVLQGKKCLLSCMIDLTEQKKHERELQKANELFSILFNENPTGVIISRLNDGKIFDCNKAYIDLVGYSKSELVGKKIEDLNILVKQGIRATIAEQIKQHNTINNFELEIRNKSGSIISGLLSGQLITIDGEAYILVILKDNTIYKKAEADMLQALAKERELSQMKSDFVTLASHEFRTPLSTIQSSADLLALYPETSQQEERLKHVRRIHLSVQKLTAILKEFLTADKIEAGEITPSLTSVNIKEFIADICREMQLMAKDGQYLNYKHTGEILVNTDAEFLQHILVNLISNAIKYSPAKSPIIITSKLNDHTFTIIVKDNGIGIPKEDQKNLFTRFYRASNTVNIQGTGLGLYIAKRYSEMLDGTITLESELSKGSEFIINMPINKYIS